MYRLTILYGTPDDPVAFDAYYRDIHLPIASRMRGLTGWTMNHVRSPPGVDPPYHLVVDLYAESEEAMTTILDSPEGRAAADDVENFATGGVTYLYGDDETIVPIGPSR